MVGVERCPRSPPTGGRLSLKGPGSGSKRPQAHWPLASRGAAEPDPECQASAVLGRSHSRTACREAQQVPVVHLPVRAAAAQCEEGFQEGRLEAPGLPRPQHLGLSREPAGRSTWPPGGNTISVQQWHNQDPHQPPARGHRCPWGPALQQAVTTGGKLFSAAAPTETQTRGLFSGQEGCTSGKPLSFDLKSPPQNW